MDEYMSLKVSSTQHADLATQLTTLSTQGWNVVNIVSTGADLIAYLARPQTPAGSPSSTVAATVAGSATSVGWAAATSPATPVQTTDSPTTTGAAPASHPTSDVPADWYRDPAGRYEYRYWDGTKWTDNVSRAGVTYKDPPIP